jgi:hypothetical protein
LYLILQILHLKNAYSIQYQLMEKEGEMMESFYQSRPISEIELEYLTKSLDIQFLEKNIPEFIIELFYKNINKN